LSKLGSLKNEGLPLDILQDPTPGKYLSRRMTRLMREQAIGRYSADWVLPLDADEFVALADDRPLIPDDLWATMFHHLGIDYRNTSFLDHRGRPMPILPYGEAIKELDV
jgi:hypothetical protein